MGIQYGEKRSPFIDYGRPSLFLDFAKRKSLVNAISKNNLITFTRSSTATYVGSDGYIKTAAADEARFDHDPETGESLGLLIEEQRTNLITQSTGSNHSGINGLSALNNDPDIIAPNGTNTAVTYTPTSPSAYNEHSIAWEYGPKSVTLNYGTEYTFSYFIKPNEKTVAYDMGPRVLNPFTTHQLWFKSINGRTAGKIYYRYSATEVPSNLVSVVRYPNNWWRVYAKVFLSGTGTYLFRTGVYALGSTGQSSYTVTDSEVGEISMWGWQLEQGSFPTSYIPTSGSAVTRQPDNAQITGSNFSSWYNQSEGSFYTDMKLNPSFPVSGLASVPFTLSDSSYNNRITLASSTGSNAFNADVAISGTQYRAVLGNYTSGSNSVKSSIGYKSADTAGSLNGASPVTSSPSGSLPLLTRADIGKAHDNINYLSGHIRRITYYPTRLTNTQLQALTQ